jgi:hypothetical protein
LHCHDYCHKHIKKSLYVFKGGNVLSATRLICTYGLRSVMYCQETQSPRASTKKGSGMKKYAYTALAAAAALSLAACGKSDRASEEASPENVEMPAEEAISNVDAAAAPVADAAATATATPEVSASASATAPAAVAPEASASTAVEQATAEAEKKM